MKRTRKRSSTATRRAPQQQKTRGRPKKSASASVSSPTVDELQAELTWAQDLIKNLEYQRDSYRKTVAECSCIPGDSHCGEISRADETIDRLYATPVGRSFRQKYSVGGPSSKQPIQPQPQQQPLSSAMAVDDTPKRGRKRKQTLDSSQASSASNDDEIIHIEFVEEIDVEGGASTSRKPASKTSNKSVNVPYIMNANSLAQFIITNGGQLVESGAKAGSQATPTYALISTPSSTNSTRLPPPIPVPPPTLDLEQLISKRVEDAASASAPLSPNSPSSSSTPSSPTSAPPAAPGEGGEGPSEETDDPSSGSKKEAAQVLSEEQKLLDNFIFVCSICFGSFRTEKDVSVHKYVIHKVASYICSYYDEGNEGCDFVSQDVEIFKKHEALHVSQPEHFCKICLEIFETAKDLTTHITEKHATYRCYVCGLILPNRALHNSHMISFHKEAALKCEFCTYKTYLKGPFEKHVRIHRQYRPCTVEGCGEAFSTEERLDAHINRLHKNERVHRCEYREEGEEESSCNEAFYNIKKLQQHLVEVHGDSLLKCDKCSYKANNKRALTLHGRGCHKEVFGKKHICSVLTNEATGSLCGAAFRSAAHLEAHIGAHHTPVKAFPCEMENCDRSFRSAAQLARHTREAHPQDVAVLETSHVDVDLAYLSELISGASGIDGGENGVGAGGDGGGGVSASEAIELAGAKQSANFLNVKPFQCSIASCGAWFGRRTELIKHEQGCSSKRRVSLAQPSKSSTSRKSASKASESKGRGRKSTSTSSQPSRTLTTSISKSLASTSAAAEAAAQAEAEKMEAAAAIDSLIMMKHEENGGHDGGASSSGMVTEEITTEVIHGPIELSDHGEHQYFTTSYHSQ